MNIKKVVEKDAEKFLELLMNLDKESSFMMYEEGERSKSIKEIEKIIKYINSNGIILAIEKDKQLIGYISAERGGYRRIKHSAYIVIGILENFHGMGLGKKLMKSINAWAEEKKLIRLELTVLKENERAVNLYKKSGYEIEGLRKSSMKVEATLKDEYYMSKIF